MNINNYIESPLHLLSIQQGLITPEKEIDCHCIHCKETPSTVEQALAIRQHRWKEMRELQKEYFVSLAKNITQYEKDMLALLKLPSIETVRQSVINDDVDRAGQFQYTDSMDAGIKRIFKEWEQAFIGGIELKVTEQQSLYDWFQKLAFMIGFNRVRAAIARILPVGMPDSFLDQFMADLSNPYYLEMLKNGANRIKTKIAIDNMRKVRKALIEMAKAGNYPLDVARFLHKNVGEGELWYWLRIARSEAVLASNAAHNYLAEKAGTNYEQWSAAANACPICGDLNGRVWRRGEGPEPVSSTHPHCCCTRIALYNHNGILQSRWNEPSPYKN